MTIFAAGKTIGSLYSSVKRQHSFINKELGNILANAQATNDGSLEASDFKKITNYYGLAVPAILGDAICALRGFKMSYKERLALTYQGAMTGLFDDFFDKYDMSDEKVMTFMEHPEELEGDNSAEKLFLFFYKNALANAHNPSLVLQYLREVYKAQVESKKQATTGLTKEEILDITIRKGGVSVLFYRAALCHPFVANEETALHQMGGLMQFGNDVFDIYKDNNAGIHTLVTTMQNTDSVRKLFTAELNKSIALTNSLSYPLKNKKKSLQLVIMSLCSRCYVFFDQLEENEKSTNNIFTIEKYSRKQLVCDMDLLINKWKTIRYFIKQKYHIY